MQEVQRKIAERDERPLPSDVPAAGGVRVRSRPSGKNLHPVNVQLRPFLVPETDGE